MKKISMSLVVLGFALSAPAFAQDGIPNLQSQSGNPFDILPAEYHRPIDVNDLFRGKPSPEYGTVTNASGKGFDHPLRLRFKEYSAKDGIWQLVDAYWECGGIPQAFGSNKLELSTKEVYLDRASGKIYMDRQEIGSWNLSDSFTFTRAIRVDGKGDSFTFLPESAKHDILLTEKSVVAVSTSSGIVKLGFKRIDGTTMAQLSSAVLVQGGKKIPLSISSVASVKLSLVSGKILAGSTLVGTRLSADAAISPRVSFKVDAAARSLQIGN